MNRTPSFPSTASPTAVLYVCNTNARCRTSVAHQGHPVEIIRRNDAGYHVPLGPQHVEMVYI